MSLPDFLLVGPERAGVTWLADRLAGHRRIAVPLRETGYFGSLDRFLSLDWYRAQFTGLGGRLAGDASAGYALLPDDVIEGLVALRPGLKVALMLRHPIDRAWGHFLGATALREHGCAPTRLDDLMAHPDMLVRRLLDEPFLAAGDYERIVGRWLAHLPPGALHVMFDEEMRREPAGLLGRLAEFLGVENRFPGDPGPFDDGAPLIALPPAARRLLERLLAPSLASLGRFLADRLAVVLPGAWCAPVVDDDGDFPLGLYREQVIRFRAGVFEAVDPLTGRIGCVATHPTPIKDWIDAAASADGGGVLPAEAQAQRARDALATASPRTPGEAERLLARAVPRPLMARRRTDRRLHADAARHERFVLGERARRVDAPDDDAPPGVGVAWAER